MARKVNGRPNLVDELRRNPELLKAFLAENKNLVAEMAKEDPELRRQIVANTNNEKKAQREREADEVSQILGRKIITAEIDGQVITCIAKRFSSGRVGYYGNGKVWLDGAKYQVSLNIVKIGS